MSLVSEDNVMSPNINIHPLMIYVVFEEQGLMIICLLQYLFGQYWS